MIKKAESKSDYEKLFNSLAEDLMRANGYHKQLMDLVELVEPFDAELKSYDGFWKHTFDALQESRFNRLAKVYDPQPNSLSLVTLLKTIKQSKDFILEVSKKPSKYSEHQLQKDIINVSKKNLKVKALIKLRHLIFAHRGANVVLGQLPEKMKELSVSNDDFKNLVTDAGVIINRYSLIMFDSVYGFEFPIEGDSTLLLEDLSTGRAIRLKNI